MAGCETSRPWIIALPSKDRLRGSLRGAGGTVSVSRTWSWLGGTRPPPKANPAGAPFKASAISLENPSLRRAYTVMGTVVPPRALMLDGTSRNSKSGRGGLMRSR
jgi:hypothetical protein